MAVEWPTHKARASSARQRQRWAQRQRRLARRGSVDTSTPKPVKVGGGISDALWAVIHRELHGGSAPRGGDRSTPARKPRGRQGSASW